ncbi:methyltransferase domain-containing protein [Pelagibacterales bacterium SAG-MED39]|nr:methyltransferase domain-containing protein [Pelagibacterales bacterium SAG-MED39]
MKKFLNLGLQPLANSYVLKKNLSLKEKKFKLVLAFNPKNYLVSIINKIPKEKMFNKNYPYKSSESKTMQASFMKLADKIKKKFKPKFIVEIGCNDGAFIKNFDKRKIVGIEPCKNLAKITRSKGFKVYSEYWNLKLSKKIIMRKKVDVIYSANTLSHITNYSEIFRAIKNSLSNRGILILEDPSLLNCLKNVAYDQFYCEHVYVFSTIALKNILSKFDLEIFDIENIGTHGGSNRYYIKNKKNSFFKVKKNVKIELNKELNYGLHKFLTYKKFANKVKNSKKELLQIFDKLKNKKIIGYGATAKSCTVLNYCNLNFRQISFFYDTTSFKINKYLPGTKILIKKYKKLKNSDADYVFLGAWNFKSEIFTKEREYIKNGGKFITHVPIPKII